MQGFFGVPTGIPQLLTQLGRDRRLRRWDPHYSLTQKMQFLNRWRWWPGLGNSGVIQKQQQQQQQLWSGFPLQFSFIVFSKWPFEILPLLIIPVPPLLLQVFSILPLLQFSLFSFLWDFPAAKRDTGRCNYWYEYVYLCAWRNDRLNYEYPSFFLFLVGCPG